MRFTSAALGALTLILLVLIPVGGAPLSLQKGSQAIYHLSASISFSPLVCEPTPTFIAQSTIVCPMIVSIPSTVNIAGTLGWVATNKSSTSVNLNVTRDLTILSDDTVVPVAHDIGSFNESIDLATRIVSIMPFLMPEIDRALQMAQTSQGASLPLGMTLSSAMNSMDPSLAIHPIHTMWWVNGPLKANQTIEVLAFPTNVTGLTSIDLGSLGTRQAWALVFKPSPLIVPQPMATGASTMQINNNVQVVFTFNYDKISDLLLSASTDIHVGFMSPVQVQCDPTLTLCSSASPPTIFQSSSMNIHASLTLTSITNLSLDQPVGVTGSPGGTSGSGSGSGSGTGSGTGTGSNGGTGTGTGSGPGGSASGPSSGAGSGNGQGSGSPGGSGSNSGSSPQPSSRSPSVPSWIYWVLGVVAVAIITTGLWIARERMRKKPQMSPPS